ncbi:MAG: hypothetical protein Q9169_006944 [Polycauliona sp. 2 TL-2023]
MGDPIDTAKNLLRKVAACQKMAEFWKRECKCLLEPPDKDDEDHQEDLNDKNWKALTLVADAYGEWQQSDAATRILHTALSSSTGTPPVQAKITEAVRITARALAADRSTKLLPIIVAEFLFIATIGIGMGKTTSGARKRTSGDPLFVNVEAHSVAFSALYFWILPAVFMGALIGVSQTEDAIPRILRRFQVDMERLLSTLGNQSSIATDEVRLRLAGEVKILNECFEKDREIKRQERMYKGGIYSWQPSKWQLQMPVFSTSLNGESTPVTTVESPSRRAPRTNAPLRSFIHRTATSLLLRIKKCRTQDIVPYAIVMLGLLTGIIISSLVPPAGWVDCRRIAEVLLVVAWVISALLDNFFSYVFPMSSDWAPWLFWATFVKDLLMTIATAGGIVVTVVGVMNSCPCYTNWGRIGLALPERPDLARMLMHGIDKVYPSILFTSMGIELLAIPAFICFRHRYALRVFIQRDDRTSNAVWFWKLHRKFRLFKRYLSSLSLPRITRQSALQRSMTSGERGLRNGSDEMERLTVTDSNSSAAGADLHGHQNETMVWLPEVPIHTNSWGIDPGVGSGTDDFPRSEPRRRDTELLGENSNRSEETTQSDQRPNRKPKPTYTPPRS